MLEQEVKLEFGVIEMSKVLTEWQLTPWLMDGKGGWQQQPIITITGQIPFFADYPNNYIEKLQQLHDDPTIARGAFYTLIGQLKDGLEQSWNVGRETQRGRGKVK